ncbi:MAG: hypothetical protein K0Q92_2416 [Steroidobacteraceae bacterium]|nr:hypothetical protein [Steroidobacteraceae bacterium]
MRRDDDQVAIAGQYGRREPLAAPPLHAGEVHQRRAGLDEQRADAVFAHERARLVEARKVFGPGNGLDAAGHGREFRGGLPGEQPRGWQRGEGGSATER